MIRTGYRITVTASLDLNEAQMRALEALVGYGTQTFLDAFYQKLGKHYLSPHEHGLRTLFEKVKEDIRPALGACDRARKAIEPKPLPQPEEKTDDEPVCEGCDQPAGARRCEDAPKKEEA